MNHIRKVYPNIRKNCLHLQVHGINEHLVSQTTCHFINLITTFIKTSYTNNRSL